MASADTNFKFPSTRRLKSASDYASINRAPHEHSIRAARRLLSVTGAWSAIGAKDSCMPPVRFGVIAGKRYARRAVDRVLIKRILREACRQQAGEFERCVRPAALRFDIVLRLRSSLVNAQGGPLAMTQWRRQVRAEADALLQQVLRQMSATVSAANPQTGQEISS